MCAHPHPPEHVCVCVVYVCVLCGGVNAVCVFVGVCIPCVGGVCVWCVCVGRECAGRVFVGVCPRCVCVWRGVCTPCVCGLVCVCV